MASESESRETSADVLAYLRSVVFAMKVHDAMMPEVYDILCGVAFRLESAWKRERVEIATTAAAQAVNLTNEKFARTPVGNAAAMREALEELRSRLSYLSPRIIHIRPDGKHSAPWVMEQLKIIEDSLSAPARNCDVGTAEEQTTRMRAHCNRLKPACRDEEGNRCKCYGDIYKENCWLAWAQMPYETKGESDGSK